jgi:hypothetical protein
MSCESDQVIGEALSRFHNTAHHALGPVYCRLATISGSIW